MFAFGRAGRYVTFMTVTYAVQSLTQWINVMSSMYKIHSAVTSLGLLWSQLLPFNDHIAMETKYKVRTKEKFVIYL